MWFFGCASQPEEFGPPIDPLPGLALTGRGDTYEERQYIADLDRKRDWAGLLRYAEERQRREPARSEWAVMAGYAWFRSGDYAKAIALLSRVTLNNPEDIWAWNLLGESQRLARQPGRAVQTLERASSVGRSSFATFFLLGEAYRDAGRLDRAITAYREVVRLEPEFARGWFELGAASIRIREFEEAKMALDQLEKLDPGLGEVLRERFRSGKK